MNNKGLITRLPFFVLIFSIYPVLALLSTNIREVEPGVVLRPLFFSLIGTFVLLTILRLLFKNWLQASYAATAVLVFFFSYGHLTRLISDRLDASLYKAIQITIYLVFIALIALTWRWILQAGSSISGWTRSINVIALVLVLFPIFQISSFLLKGRSTTLNANMPIESTPVPDQQNSGTYEKPSNDIPASTGTDPGQYPDVYLIVLDGYARADTLKELGYDNSEFLSSLQDRGFYVASCSRSNYRHTLLSMSSMFSMDLLWRAIPNGGATDHNAAPLYDVLIHNAVRSEFEQRGYKTVAFQTGYQWDQWTDADYYFAFQSDTPISTDVASYSLTPFEYLFLKNTAAYPFIENSSLATHRFYGHYQDVNFTLDELPKAATSIPGPKFVYAHIMAPHTPYIFLPDGSLNTDTRFYNSETGAPSNPGLHAEGYTNNVKYLNRRMIGILDEIIKKSKIPPIIIVMGDHGFVLEERRFNNLMAFHLPNGGNASLYPTITPINTFRIIDNLYFGAKLELRNDVSNNGDVGNPFVQKRVPPFPETCP